MEEQGEIKHVLDTLDQIYNSNEKLLQLAQKELDAAGTANHLILETIDTEKLIGWAFHIVKKLWPARLSKQWVQEHQAALQEERQRDLKVLRITKSKTKRKK